MKTKSPLIKLKAKKPDPFRFSPLYLPVISYFLKNYSKIICRLNKKYDFYLHTIITNPNRVFSFDELYFYKQFVTNPEVDYQTRINFNIIDFNNSDFYIESVDEQAIASINKRIDFLNKKLLQFDDLEEIKILEIKDELCILKKYLSKSVKKNSRKNSYNLFGNGIQTKRSIKASISVSLQKIKDRDFEIYSYLINHLITDNYLVFLIGGSDDPD